MARSFNGSSDVIDATVSYTGNTFSLVTWMFVNAIDSYDMIIGVRGGNFDLKAIAFTGASKLAYSWEGGSDEFDGAGLTVSTGVWHLAGLTISPTEAVVYLNTNTWTNTKTHNSKTISTWKFGKDRDFDRWFNGNLAEVGMWDATLTAAEMGILAKGFSPQFVRPGNLLAYWPLIGKHSPEDELISNGTGTLTGTAAADHPRIIYPKPRRVIVPSAAAAGGTPYEWMERSRDPVRKAQQRIVGGGTKPDEPTLFEAPPGLSWYQPAAIVTLMKKCAASGITVWNPNTPVLPIDWDVQQPVPKMLPKHPIKIMDINELFADATGGAGTIVLNPFPVSTQSQPHKIKRIPSPY